MNEGLQEIGQSLFREGIESSKEVPIEESLGKLETIMGIEPGGINEMSADDLERRIRGRAQEDIHEYQMTTDELIEDIFGREDMVVDFREAFSVIVTEPKVLKNNFMRRLEAVNNEDLPTGEQLSADLVKKLELRSKDIERFIEQCEGSPEKMFQAVFDDEPSGKIELETTPYTVELYTNNRDDYVAARKALIKQEGGSEQGVDISDSGMYISSTRVPLLPEGGVILADKSSYGGSVDLEGTVRHERQHAFRDMMEREWKERIYNVFYEAGDRGIVHCIRILPEEEKKFTAAEILKSVRDAHFELSVKDELLAFYRGGTSNRITEDLLTEDPAYNKFLEHRDDIVQDMVEEGIDKNEANFVYDMIFGESYDVKVHNLLSTMEDVRKTGLTRAEVATLLTTKKLEEWPEVVEEQRAKVG